MICDGGRSAKGEEERVVKLKDYPAKVLPLQNVDGNGNMPEYADMVELPYLHEVRQDLFLISHPVSHRMCDQTNTHIPTTLYVQLDRPLFCIT